MNRSIVNRESEVGDNDSSKENSLSQGGQENMLSQDDSSHSNFSPWGRSLTPKQNRSLGLASHSNLSIKSSPVLLQKLSSERKVDGTSISWNDFR